MCGECGSCVYLICGGYLIALDGGHWLNYQSQWYFDATQQVIGTWYSVHGRPHVSRVTTSYTNTYTLSQQN